MTTPTIFWHDYETSGADKRRDRPLQFAGIRTTLDLKPVGDPVMIYCRPSSETLPHIMASMITGLTPQECLEKGFREAEFAHIVHRELAAPGTCGAGYNSLRFDDEITRHLFYRTFHEPYDREWQNGNSRWDLIDLARMCYALRPEGIVWPTNAEGLPSFRLEELASANKLQQTRAHDALSDVEATIGLAQLIKTKQPGLYNFYFELRRKQRAQEVININHPKPLIHISSFYPSSQGCLTSILPISVHPKINNDIIVFDLMSDPIDLFTLDAEGLAAKLFQTGKPDDGSKRLGVSTIHTNKCPAVAPMSALKDVDLKRIGLDLDRCRDAYQKIMGSPEVITKLRQAFALSQYDNTAQDPELSLYGAFPSTHDKNMMRAVRECPATELSKNTFAFQSAGLNELLFRYRARNWPELLNADETARWEAHRRDRLLGDHPASSLTLEGYRTSLSEARANPDLAHHQTLFGHLEQWGNGVEASLNAIPSSPKFKA